jgi:predicted helicase
VYIIDLGGNVRANPKLSGTKHNVFGIQTGVAISFMIKREESDRSPCKIWYSSRPEFDSAEDKFDFLTSNKFDKINFRHISPDKRLNQR